MINKVIRVLFAPIGGALGFWLWRLIDEFFKIVNVTFEEWGRIICEIAAISIMAIIGYIIGGPISKWCTRMFAKITKQAKEMPAKDLFVALAGLLVGFVGAFLLCQIFNKIDNAMLVTCLNALIYICCGFLGIRVFLLRRDDVSISLFKRRKGESVDKAVGGTVLDSSILIDGRAFDVLKTGFLKEPIYVPKFVLDELTRLSDSEDSKKRTRGRIGLDTVKKLREDAKVIISARDYDEAASIDDLLIKFAKDVQADIMTNDYSLNMVASVQDVRILNINELANALKPTVVAGDELNIEISKRGKEASQGVGYLDDGTMIVVENGSEYVDKFVDIVVTSMLQTNAGKIIFAKIKE